MAGRGDIEAGKAHIRLYMKNSEVVKGLNWLGGKMQGIGTTVMKTGGMIAGLGAAIIAPFAAAVGTFMEVGGNLADMSARTGMAAGTLAELGFAADQTGASLEDVEAGTRKMNKVIAEAASGSKSAKEALAAIGLTAADLKGKLPDEQLEMIGDRLTAIQDPAKRTAATMEILGKSGTKLLPMLENLRGLREEARRLGLAPTEGAVQLADDLGDAWDSLGAVIKATIFEVGAALAPVLLPAAKAVTNIAASINRWVRENGALIRTVAAIGAALVVAGGIITVIGASIFGLGTVLTFAATGLATLAAALLSPLTLVAALGAALVAGVVYWARFTESGRASVQAIIGFFAPMVETMRTAVGAIGDALMAGDLALAGQIAIKGLQIVFAQGIAALSNMLGGTLGETIGDIGTRLLQGDLQGAWNTVVLAMGKIWADFAEGMVAVFTQAAGVVVTAWEGAVNKISGTIIEASAGKGVGGGFLKGISAGLGVDVTGMADAVVGADMQKIQAERDRLNKALGLGPEDVTEEAKASAAATTGATANAAREFLDGLDRAMQEQSNAIGEDLRGRVSGGGQRANDEAARLQAELDALAGQAKAAKEAAAAGDVANPDLALDGGAAGMKQASFATFSAAAAIAFGGGGGGVAERQLEETRAMRRLLDAANGELQKLNAKPRGGLRD